MSDFLVSPLIEQQLPSFVRDEYSNFILFIEKYYEWMEQSGNVIHQAKSLGDAQDLDLADDFYIELIKREFLPYFPESTSLDPRKFLKLVDQFYAAKGTPLSVQFLFRALFDEDIHISYPKDQILVVSDGKWVLPLALRIDTDDDNIFNIKKCLLIGEKTKATSIVEQVIKSVDRQLGISYIELYISNIDRLYETGETVTATYNDGTTDITVSGTLIGSLSEIKVDANNRGLFYNAYDPLTGYDGDPLTIVGGLNTSSNTPIGAMAYVGETTKGSITDVIVTNGGFGFRDPKINLNSSIIDFSGGFDDTQFGTEAKAEISLLDSSTVRKMNVSSTMIETLLSTNISSIENTEISLVSTYDSFNVYPISFISLTGGGGGYKSKPSVDIHSMYLENNDDLLIPGVVNIVKGTSQINSSSVDFSTYVEAGDYVRLFINNRYEEFLYVTGVSGGTLYFDKVFPNNISGVSVYHVMRSELRQLGSLGRIEILDGGEDYQVGEYLIFTGGSGYGANAVITSVHSSNNGIKSVDFVQNGEYIIGGEAYTPTSLPTLTVDTVSGSNASMRVTEITGDGETLNFNTTRIGAVSKIRVLSYGYDYVSAPTISLRNMDVVVSNVTSGQLFVSNTRVYQGTSNLTSTFSAYVDKYEQNSGLLRIYDYTGNLDKTKNLISDDGVVSANITSVTYYGDGRAKATSKFENGLIRLPGLYLNTDGQVSSDKVMQDGKRYHSFSYVINASKEYKFFKTTLENVVHPIGTKVFVNRTDTNNEVVEYNSNTSIVCQTVLPVSFNVGNGSNNLVSTSESFDLTEYVQVGDVIILMDVQRQINGTVNISSGANTIIGTETNFINDIQDGDVIFVSSGNTQTVINVVDDNSAQLQNSFGVTANDLTINVIFNSTKTVSYVNANTILVTTNFNVDAVNANAMVQISQ